MEKRKFTRVPFRVEASVKYKDMECRGEVENLSLRGMFLRMPEKISLGECVDITILLAGDTSKLTIDLKGKVARTDPDGIGIKFQEIDLDSFVHLKNIVTYNSGDAEKIMQEFINAAEKGGETDG
ncbi:hypothetical protein DCCM_3401 [Desulfocucumis palustris]|uniref:PilZ domain-containing protein n=1 Tax=Desulfocucumis palustris TaxID=1898651 RepID=A0A2L2XD65_9FIRM|nr:PilZ domain-containing protein [Desulfocucumis palustris]GBF34289.1 hypothetical protein DCCM_3401 [Desulfocucumis palustris]